MHTRDNVLKFHFSFHDYAWDKKMLLAWSRYADICSLPLPSVRLASLYVFKTGPQLLCKLHQFSFILEHLLRSELFQLHYVPEVSKAPLCVEPSCQVCRVRTSALGWQISHSNRRLKHFSWNLWNENESQNVSRFNQHISSFYALKHSGNHTNELLHRQNCTSCPESARVSCELTAIVPLSSYTRLHFVMETSWQFLVE
jgi:hypothetical protein